MRSIFRVMSVTKPLPFLSDIGAAVGRAVEQLSDQPRAAALYFVEEAAASPRRALRATPPKGRGVVTRITTTTTTTTTVEETGAGVNRVPAPPAVCRCRGDRARARCDGSCHLNWSAASPHVGVVRAWEHLVVFYLRLQRKRTQWAVFGQFLKAVKDRGASSR